MRQKFLSAEWRKLAIANYAIEDRILKPFLPYKTEIDKWADKTYVSLVGFRFINTRLKGFPVPLHRHFEEINLRFYVRFKENGIWKRGVTFIKEIVPKPALAFIANTIYKEKYITLPTRYNWKEEQETLTVSYSWKYKNKWDRFSIVADNNPTDIPPDSHTEFITEHYWGYTPVNTGCCFEYQVEHPRWKAYKVLENIIDVSFGKLYGGEFSFLEERKPESVMLAEGSEVSVYSKSKIL
jgi:uncharacterized protein